MKNKRKEKMELAQKAPETAKIPLPEGANTEEAAATFRNGVLEITMRAPKVETSTRKLEIKEPTGEKSIKAAA